MAEHCTCDVEICETHTPNLSTRIICRKCGKVPGACVCDSPMEEIARLWARVAELERDIANVVQTAVESNQAHVLAVDDLRAEIARLTPQATRDLPQSLGFYWYVTARGAVDMVQVTRVHGRDGLMFTRIGDNEIYSTDDVGTGGLWSREPIPAMAVPASKENEDA